VNVEHASHEEIFSRIKAIDDRVCLLVVDYATEQHLRQRDVTIDGEMTQVPQVTCSDVSPPRAVAADPGIND